MTIEVDITHRCNLACRHCNRLCNADENLGIKRPIVDMNMRHIDFLISEVKKLPKGHIEQIRILGGEPLLSNIITKATQSFINLMENGYIRKLTIVTNGTIEIPEVCKPYIVYAPLIVEDIIKEKGLVSPQDIYAIKNAKHRNITVTPIDFNLGFQICDRVKECGIHYTVYGFSYTAPCFPSLMISPDNHKYFIHQLPYEIGDLIKGDFIEDVCSICCFAINKYNELAEKNPQIQNPKFVGSEWSKKIRSNRTIFTSPDTSWINDK